MNIMCLDRYFFIHHQFIKSFMKYIIRRGIVMQIRSIHARTQRDVYVQIGCITCSIESGFHFNHCTHCRSASAQAISFLCRNCSQLRRQGLLLLLDQSIVRIQLPPTGWRAVWLRSHVGCCTARSCKLTHFWRRQFHNMGRLSIEEFLLMFKQRSMMHSGIFYPCLRALCFWRGYEPRNHSKVIDYSK